jgi:hypothetical protein
MYAFLETEYAAIEARWRQRATSKESGA